MIWLRILGQRVRAVGKAKESRSAVVDNAGEVNEYPTDLWDRGLRMEI